MKDNRIEWIDRFKGYGIFLVMLAHTSINESISKYIYSFHVPLFFFISGYLFLYKRDVTTKTYINKKIKTLIKPYIIFALLSYIFWFLIGRKVGSKVQNLDITVLYNFLGYIYANGSTTIIFNGALWFLPCLFIVSLVFFIINRKLEKFTDIIIILIVIFGFMYCKYLVYFRLPWHIDTALIAVGFYWLGYKFKNQNIINKISKLNYSLIITFILIITGFITHQHNIKVGFMSLSFGNQFIMIISSISSIIGYSILFVNLNKGILFEKIGELSLYMLGLHYFYYAFFKLVLSKVFKKDLHILDGSTLYGVTFVILTSISIVITMKIIKYLRNIYKNRKI